MVLWEFAQAFKPPRTVECNFPLGATLGRPNDPAMQRAVLRAGFAMLPAFAEPWQTRVLPIAWNNDGDRSWEEATKDLYRNDHASTMQSHQSEHREIGDVLAGNEIAFVNAHGV